MGRPLNKKYFGNRNVGSISVTTDNGIGGEGVESVTIVQGTGKTDGSKTVTIALPDLPNGVRATATAVVAAGVLTITMTEAGSGYSTAPTVTVTGGGTGWTYTAVLTTSTGPVSSVTNQENAIVAYAFTGSSSKVADIVKQVNSHDYNVNTADTAGTPIRATLKGSAATAVGEMTIKATDVNGNTYFVTKLTARKAVLTRDTQNGSNAWVYATGETAPWSFDAAATIYVQVENA